MVNEMNGLKLYDEFVFLPADILKLMINIKNLVFIDMIQKQDNRKKDSFRSSIS